MVTIRAFRPAHLELVGAWLEEPHVARWYLAGSSARDELEDLRRSVGGAGPTHLAIVLDGDRPVGWCQWYLLSAYPDHAAAVGGAPGDVGIDYAIGDPSCIGRGIGTRLVGALVEHLRRQHPGSGIVADPQAANIASCRVLEHNRFELLGVRPLATEPTGAPMAIYRLDSSTGRPQRARRASEH